MVPLRSARGFGAEGFSAFPGEPFGAILDAGYQLFGGSSLSLATRL